MSITAAPAEHLPASERVARAQATERRRWLRTRWGLSAPAVIIIALIPLALRGVKYRPMSAAALLRRNLLIYGLGGIVVPFLGIKIIDVVIHAMGLA